MKLVKLIQCKCSETPPEQGIRVLQDEDGFYWLEPRVKAEGYRTPFIDLAELALAHDLTNIHVVTESAISIDVPITDL
ncbi:hypothetical protein [Simiduia agarivorans]|uniref:Uncharacterized protein n=1 Tax=Simiduia agarivorans (strain DSM 21679 / JCM 13881 / BCRC 17597 / SA1) TaxID=1117647 RepID=K4KFU4_SIMAS|nr:hypothetical protein [Simiduia agarivorans]AFU97816.1 hypothetical protein M5M_03025 [Simiduia agarivorans SA1 = DSM 21679]